MGKNLDEEAFRTLIDETIECAKDCHLEFTFRDVYTVEGNFDKPRRAEEIVRQELEKYWK